jgi:hypothetical protein
MQLHPTLTAFSVTAATAVSASAREEGSGDELFFHQVALWLKVFEQYTACLFKPAPWEVQTRKINRIAETCWNLLGPLGK